MTEREQETEREGSRLLEREREREGGREQGSLSVVLELNCALGLFWPKNIHSIIQVATVP